MREEIIGKYESSIDKELKNVYNKILSRFPRSSSEFSRGKRNGLRGGIPGKTYRRIKMEVFITILLFIVGLGLVVKGGDIFVDAASFIAKAMKIPSFIIGATIVSLATTLPEMIVSVIAAAEGNTEMAVGNAVGSVTANTALILGVAMVSMHIVCERKRFVVPISLLIAASGGIWLFCLGGRLSVWGSVVLALIFVGFMVYNVVSAKKSSNTVPSEELSKVAEEHEKALETPEENEGKTTKKTIVENVILFIVGAAGIVGGSQLMVTYGSKIAIMLGVEERVIAVTLIAVGTSLPELVTTITAIIKKESALSIGNIIGANIIDLSLILPICSLVSGQQLPVSPQSLAIDLPACFIATVLAMVPVLVRQKTSRILGIICLAGYVGYVILTVTG